MASLAALFGFVSYVLQQAGVLFGVGAETVLLSAYLAHGAKALHWRHEPQIYLLQRVGLGLIVLSGLGAVALHAWRGEETILLAPAFVLKWVVIAALMGMYVLERRTTGEYEQALVRGMTGAQWYALLIVHGLAPMTDWSYLLLLYVGWLAVFMVGWAGFLYLVSPVPKAVAQKLAPKADALKQVEAPAQKPSLQKSSGLLSEPSNTAGLGRPDFSRETSALLSKSSPPTPPNVAAAPAPTPPKPAPAPIAPKGAPPKPSAAMPVVYHQELEAPHHMPAPAPKPPVAAPAPTPPRVAPAPKPPVAPQPAPAPRPPAPEPIPAIRVMPRSPEELNDAARGAVVQFN